MLTKHLDMEMSDKLAKWQTPTQMCKYLSSETIIFIELFFTIISVWLKYVSCIWYNLLDFLTIARVFGNVWTKTWKHQFLCIWLNKNKHTNKQSTQSLSRVFNHMHECKFWAKNFEFLIELVKNYFNICLGIDVCRLPTLSLLWMFI